jgi:hypothetical protein
VGQVSAAVRKQARERDGNSCVARGVLPGKCWGALEAGHIVGRGNGGTPDADLYDEVQWLVTHCTGHNRAIESDAAARAAAKAAGQRLSRIHTSLLPARALVLYPDGEHYYLNPDGTKERMNGWSQE